MVYTPVLKATGERSLPIKATSMRTQTDVVYVATDENGVTYTVIKPDFTNSTALCKSDAWIGWARCRFATITKPK